jgi:hypothetical protein
VERRRSLFGTLDAQGDPNEEEEGGEEEEEEEEILQNLKRARGDS